MDSRSDPVSRLGSAFAQLREADQEQHALAIGAAQRTERYALANPEQNEGG